MTPANTGVDQNPVENDQRILSFLLGHHVLLETQFLIVLLSSKVKYELLRNEVLRESI